MSKIVWDETGKRYLESGVSRGVLYTAVLKDDEKTIDDVNSEDSESIISFVDPHDEMTRIPGGSTTMSMVRTLVLPVREWDDAVLYLFKASNHNSESSPQFPESIDWTSSTGLYGDLVGVVRPSEFTDLSALSGYGIYDLATYDASTGTLVWASPASPSTGQSGFKFSKVYIRYIPKSEIVKEFVGVPWNGLISVGSSPEGAEDNDQWADNMKYSRTKSKETWGGTIEAYQSPKEFDACDGSIEASPGVNVGQQKRNSFGLCYRTEIMSDASGGESCGYLLHLLYNLTASPSDRSYETINDSPDAITLSWELDGVPVNVDGREPLTEITVDSRYADSDSLENLENLLYGTENSEPTLPSPEDLIALFS